MVDAKRPGRVRKWPVGDQQQGVRHRIEEGAHLWTFEPGAYDQGRVGLVATFLPPAERSEDPRLHDSERRGMSAQGHDFGSGLDAEERRALLEYLKTL